MLTFEFSAQDVATVRFARSPLWELVTSLEALRNPGRHALHLPWARPAAAALADSGSGFDLLRSLVPVPATAFPDFLTPIPAGSEPTVDDEIAAVAATRPAVVRAELDRIGAPAAAPGSGPVAELYADPSAGLARLADELHRYWELTLQPHWGRMARLLDGDILYRARTMARGGAAALFADLHPKVAWAAGELRIDHRSHAARRILQDGRGLVLMPLVFAWPGVFSQSGPGSRPGLAYPPRGVATLWERGAAAAPAALAGVLGRPRALLLSELGSPASTTELAARTGIPAPTVSHHLTALRAAGLTVSHRVGRSVLYLRTERAEVLLDVDDAR